MCKTNANIHTHANGLDSLRGAAAVIVCCHHYSNGLFGTLSPDNIFVKIFSFLLCDRSAVILFFVLSGYVLSLSLMKNKQSYLQFLCKRVFRILPAYWICMIFVTVLVSLSSNDILFRAFPNEIIHNLNFEYYINAISLVSNLIWPQSMTSAHSVGNPFDSSSWSLVYEMIISACLPILFVLITKQTKCSSLISIAYIIIFYNYSNQYTAILYYSCFFSMGALIAHYEKKFPIKRISGFIVVIAMLFFMSPNIRNLFPTLKFIRLEFLDLIAGFSSIALILSAKYNYQMKKVLELNILKFYGNISYSFYLFHIPCSFMIVYIFFNMQINTTTLETKVLIKILAFIFSTIISWCIYNYVEKKFIVQGKNLCDKLDSRNKL